MSDTLLLGLVVSLVFVRIINDCINLGEIDEKNYQR